MFSFTLFFNSLNGIFVNLEISNNSLSKFLIFLGLYKYKLNAGLLVAKTWPFLSKINPLRGGILCFLTIFFLKDLNNNPLLIFEDTLI